MYLNEEQSHQPCPHPSCSSSDGFSFNPEKGVGKCFSCDNPYPAKGVNYSEETRMKYPLKEKDNVSSFVPKNIQSRDSGSLKADFIGMRGISKDTMAFYNVKTYVDSDGPVKQEYTYPSGGQKVRYFPKAFSAVGLRQDELFGMNLWNAGSARYVTVTEGELDALSAYQMLQGTYTNPVVSFPSATPSKSLWEKCGPWLDSFEKIIVATDSDAPGNALAEKIFRLFPSKTYRMNFDKYKDPNEFLEKGKKQEFKSAWYGARKFTPENVLSTPEQLLSLYRDTPDHQFAPTGIQALDDKLLGIHQGQFHVLKAATGIGKTEVMRYLEFSLLQQGIPFAAWHLEETKLRTLLGLVSYKLGKNVTRRDLIEDEETNAEVEQAIKEIAEQEVFHQFYMPEGSTVDDFIEQIRYFATAAEVKFIFFEPIQDVVSGISEDNKEALLADLSVRLSKLAAELNIALVTIGHTNEMGEVKYCRMITQRAGVVIDIHRDKESDDVEERNTTYLTIKKNRPCSEEGTAGKLRFDPRSFTLQEIL